MKRLMLITMLMFLSGFISAEDYVIEPESNQAVMYVGDDMPAFNYYGQTSVTFWVKLATTSSAYHSVLSWENKAGMPVINIAVTTMSTPIRWGRGTHLGEANSIDTQRLVAGEWAHIAVSRDGSQISFYINGELMNTNHIANYTTMPLSMIGDAYRLTLFGRHNIHESFEGRVDDLAIYSKALSAEEVMANKISVDLTDSSLEAYWDFNEGSGNILNELIRKDGTLQAVTSEVMLKNGTPSAEPLTWVLEDRVVIPAYGVVVERNGAILTWVTDYENSVSYYSVQKQNPDGTWYEITRVGAQNVHGAKYQSEIDYEGTYRVIAGDEAGGKVAYNTEKKYLRLHIKRGWNMVSMPFVDPDLSELDPSDEMWSWHGNDGRYRKINTLTPLKGVWVFSPVNKMLTISGTGICEGTLKLGKGWNLVGIAKDHTSRHDGVVYTWDPEAYKYTNETELLQGAAYWVHTDSDDADLYLGE